MNTRVTFLLALHPRRPAGRARIPGPGPARRGIARLGTAACLGLVLLTTSGCLYSREIAHTRRQIERAVDADLDREVVFVVGPLGMRAVRWATGLSHDDDVRELHDYLRLVRRVKVGVYRVDHAPAIAGLQPETLARFERRGWEVAVRYRDGEEAGWILYREHRGTVRDLFVVTLDDEDLVLARLQGRLDALLSRALEEDGDWVGWADGKK